jgi:hypothetical protein
VAWRGTGEPAPAISDPDRAVAEGHDLARARRIGRGSAERDDDVDRGITAGCSASARCATSINMIEDDAVEARVAQIAGHGG